MKNFWLKYRKFLYICAVLTAVFVLFCNYSILKFNNQIYSDTLELPTSSIAVVFGGGMTPEGEQSDMQFDRVKTGIDLYRSGIVDKILFTGDDGQFRFDEITAMKNMALDLGVKDSDILIDPHAYRTYLSCKHAAEISEIKKAIVVSQNFHLPRIRYICENFGIKTIGFSADAREYHSLWRPYLRESLARVKAWLEVNLK